MKALQQESDTIIPKTTNNDRYAKTQQTALKEQAEASAAKERNEKDTAHQMKLLGAL